MPKPVAHYKLDETSGSTAIDSSGNGNDGTINGATVNQIGYNGSVGAYSFDGTDDYVDIGHISSLNFSRTDNFTISCWVNVNGISGVNYCLLYTSPSPRDRG